MSELRRDPLTGQWVIMAVERARRPQELLSGRGRSDAVGDPFLEGHEDQTPPEILACRAEQTAPNTPGWQVRVFPNKFPALQPVGSPATTVDGIYDALEGVGAHEVIVECPQFETNMSRLPVDTIREVLWVYRERLIDLRRDLRLVFPLIFKNQGAAAGASLSHSHSQLIATPLIPPAIQAELDRARRFHQQQGKCISCQMLEQELQTKLRIVLQTPNFVLWCPFSSRFPFELRIAPTRHASRFESVSIETLAELAGVLKLALRSLEIVLDDPPLNYVIHTAPFSAQDLPYVHWHIEILPRLTGIAGLELGTGLFINSVLPEKAVNILRENARQE